MVPNLGAANDAIALLLFMTGGVASPAVPLLFAVVLVLSWALARAWTRARVGESEVERQREAVKLAQEHLGKS